MPPIHVRSQELGAEEITFVPEIVDPANKEEYMASETFIARYSIFDADGNVDPNFFAPEILNERSMWKILLTLGWRF